MYRVFVSPQTIIVPKLNQNFHTPPIYGNKIIFQNLLPKDKKKNTILFSNYSFKT